MKRHRFDPFSLIVGAIFFAIGIAFVAGSTLGEAWHSVWPMFAVVVGVMLAAWAIVTTLGQRPRQETVAAADDVREPLDSVSEAPDQPS